MKYISTRNKETNVTASQGILKGIAEDGGLFVPEEFPKLDYIKLLNKDYKEVAISILELFLDDFTLKEISDSVKGAYGDKFQFEDIVPIKKVGEISFMELFHGPTLAFKDMALTLLPYLMKLSLEKNNIDKEIMILTATSGDTGKAALEGFKDIPGVGVTVFYPHGGVSEIQRLQMVTQRGDNTHVIGINGNFDDAQTGVKKIFSDKEFNYELLNKGYILSSANSINIGRLIPQIVYYVYAYLQLIKRNEIKEGESINVVVPTGNFGNILAAFYATKIGLPINKLICASNDNNVLSDFFNTKIYNKNRKLLLTSSPSMDILVSSNLERFLYHQVKDDEKIGSLMDDLKEKGEFSILEDMDIIYSNYADEDKISYWIKKIYEEDNYIMDPHTAVAYSVYKDYMEETNDSKKTIIASTASPFKFSSKILSSLGREVSENEFENLNTLSHILNSEIPLQLKELKTLKEKHTTVVNVESMKAQLKKIIGGEYND